MTSATLAEGLARDNDPLDLIRTLVYLCDLGVTKHPLNCGLLRIADTTEQLDCVGTDRHRRIRGEAFGCRTEIAHVIGLAPAAVSCGVRERTRRL